MRHNEFGPLTRHPNRQPIEVLRECIEKCEELGIKVVELLEVKTKTARWGEDFGAVDLAYLTDLYVDLGKTIIFLNADHESTRKLSMKPFIEEIVRHLFFGLSYLMNVAV